MAAGRGTARFSGAQAPSGEYLQAGELARSFRVTDVLIAAAAADADQESWAAAAGRTLHGVEAGQLQWWPCNHVGRRMVVVAGSGVIKASSDATSTVGLP
jgi:hypothetical protein